MRIKNSWISEMCTPETLALSHKKKGTKWKKMLKKTIAAIIITAINTGASIMWDKLVLKG